MVKEVIQVLPVLQANKVSQVLQEKKALRYDVALGNKSEGQMNCVSLTFQIIMQNMQEKIRTQNIKPQLARFTQKGLVIMDNSWIIPV